MQPFAPRPIRFLRIHEHSGWRIKLYSIALQGATRPADLKPGLALALDSLPQPAQTPARPGLGFCVLHAGRGVDYAVLGWWDRENELPVRIFVRPHAESTWRPAQGGESFCVWDLQIIAFERDAYVQTVLANPPLNAADYLDRTLVASQAGRILQPTRGPTHE